VKREEGRGALEHTGKRGGYKHSATGELYARSISLSRILFTPLTPRSESLKDSSDQRSYLPGVHEPAVNFLPVDVLHEGIDVLGRGRAVVHVIEMLVHVEHQQR
jgi:hypothetical protein